MNSIELIDSLINQVSSLVYRDIKALGIFHNRAEMILSNIFKKDSSYIKRLLSINFFPLAHDVQFWRNTLTPGDIVAAAHIGSWEQGISDTVAQLELIKEELSLFENQQNINHSKKPTTSNRVFIVHGHNNEMKLATARSLEILRLKPVILHEQPNLGMTIIEKFEEYSDVGYAIVLLSPDDFGYSRKEPSTKLQSRARQNVILELGYFLGKLGRKRVMALYLQENNFEMPSDFSGVLYVPFDNAGKWQFSLVQELKACGYKVDANKLI